MFWPFWFSYFMLCGCTCAIFLVFLIKLIETMIKRNNLFELAGVFWLLEVTGGLTIISRMFVLSFLEYFDSENDISCLKTPLIFGFSYATLTISLTFFWQKSLLKFFVQNINDPEFETEENRSRRPSSIQNSHQIIVSKEIKKGSNSLSTKNLSIPVYLVDYLFYLNFLRIT